MVISDGMKKRACLFLVTATYFVISNAAAFADDRLTLIGKVSDSAGQPIEHATVLSAHTAPAVEPRCAPSCQ